MPVDTSKLIATCDPNVYAEALRRGYVRYVNIVTGERWEVIGTCTQIGKCWAGAADPTFRAYLEANQLDCPVTPKFNSVGCCQFTYNVLTPAVL